MQGLNSFLISLETIEVFQYSLCYLFVSQSYFLLNIESNLQIGIVPLIPLNAVEDYVWDISYRTILEIGLPERALNLAGKVAHLEISSAGCSHDLHATQGRF